MSILGWWRRRRRGHEVRFILRDAEGRVLFDVSATEALAMARFSGGLWSSMTIGLTRPVSISFLEVPQK